MGGVEGGGSCLSRAGGELCGYVVINQRDVLFLSHACSPTVVKSPLDKPFILHTAAKTIDGAVTEK